MNRPFHPSIWNLMANPVFKRHAVSRLRPLSFLFGLFLTQVLGAGLWASLILVEAQIRAARTGLPKVGVDNMLEYASATSYAFGWLGILTIQGFLAVSKGSFRVAIGVAREANEGMIDAQYLTPLPTGHKVAGQLFGYPVRENLLAISLIPWAVIGGIAGGLSAIMTLKVYLLFAISAVFYQLISLLVGTLIRQKILAATLSQFLVLTLAIIPLLGSMGVGIISYLSMGDSILHEIASEPSLDLKEFQKPPVAFYHWSIGFSGYHWLMMLGCIAASIAILWRRWNDQSSQLWGKPLTALAVLMFCFMTLGELLPRFRQDLALPDGALATATFIMSGDPRAAGIAGLASVCWIAGLGVGLSLINLLFVSTIIPSPAARARCRLMRSSPWWMDGREAWSWALGISLLFAAVWCYASVRMANGVNSPVEGPPSVAGMAEITLAFVIAALAWYALVLWKGWRTACAAAFVFWVIPLIVAVIARLYWVTPGDWVIALTTISAPITPAHAAFHAFGTTQSALVKASLWISLLAHAIAAVFLLRQSRRAAESPIHTVFSVSPPAMAGQGESD